MKKSYGIAFSALLIALLSSCGITGRFPLNADNWNTNVTLNDARYRIVKTVTGRSGSTYVLGIGGMSGKALYSSARADMLKHAGLKDNQAIIYTNTVVSTSGIPPFFWQNEAVASGILIEFLDGTDSAAESERQTAPNATEDSTQAAEVAAPHSDAEQTDNIAVSRSERPLIDDSHTVYNSNRTNDYVVIAKDGKFGIADKQGHIIAPCKYDYVKFILSKKVLAKCYTDDSFGYDAIYFDDI